MRERSAPGRFAFDIASEADARGIEASGHDDGGAFFFAAHGLKDEAGIECSFAALMHEASGGADVSVGETLDVFAQEVDETAIALQDRQQVQRAFFGRAALFNDAVDDALNDLLDDALDRLLDDALDDLFDYDDLLDFNDLLDLRFNRHFDDTLDDLFNLDDPFDGYFDRHLHDAIDGGRELLRLWQQQFAREHSVEDHPQREHHAGEKAGGLHLKDGVGRQGRLSHGRLMPQLRGVAMPAACHRVAVDTGDAALARA